jgi:hypothetical protein
MPSTMTRVPGAAYRRGPPVGAQRCEHLAAEGFEVVGVQVEALGGVPASGVPDGPRREVVIEPDPLDLVALLAEPARELVSEGGLAGTVDPVDPDEGHPVGRVAPDYPRDKPFPPPCGQPAKTHL